MSCLEVWKIRKKEMPEEASFFILFLQISIKFLEQLTSYRKYGIIIKNILKEKELWIKIQKML